jgi:crotonobetainyl-CoA:carnitine CoA-transferase CaiB-like acyl-CoA transferase
VPVSPIYSIADIFSDPQYAARNDIIAPEDPQVGAVPMPAVLPRFSRTPGAVRFVGPTLGEHNAEVYGGLLGLTEAEQAELRDGGVI